MECNYCRREVGINEYCRGCGAKAELSEWTRSEPFEYEGYIVWPLRHYQNNGIEFCFYKGKYLEGKHLVSRRELMERPGYHEGEDIFPEIFNEWLGSKDSLSDDARELIGDE